MNFMIKKIDLPYPLDALEPYYSKETLKVHYETLYTGYVENTNKTLEKLQKARQNNDYSNIMPRKRFKLLWFRCNTTSTFFREYGNSNSNKSKYMFNGTNK